MDVYLSVLKLSYHWFRRYPIEFWANIMKRVMQVAFMILLWITIAKENPKKETNIDELVVYFIIISAIADFVMVERLNLGRVLAKAIKDGQINQFLLKPINIVGYYYTSVIGKLIPMYIFAIVASAITLFITNSIHIDAILLGIVSLLMAGVLGFFINIFAGMLAFVVVETRNLEYMIQIIIRIFAGAYIPLQFYPEEIKSVIDLTFFPYLAYVPVQVITKGDGFEIGPEIFVIPFIWIFILGIIMLGIWNHLIKKYEAIGI